MIGPKVFIMHRFHSNFFLTNQDALIKITSDEAVSVGWHV